MCYPNNNYKQGQQVKGKTQTTNNSDTSHKKSNTWCKHHTTYTSLTEDLISTGLHQAMFKPSVRAVILTAVFVANNKWCLAFQGSGAGFSTQSGIQITSKNVPRSLIHTSTSSHTLRSKTLTSLRAWGDDNDEQLKRDEEESRLKILESRRKTIRSTLRGAESLKYYRMENGE